MKIISAFRRHYLLTALLVLLIAAGVAAHMYFNQWLLGHVNEVLSHIDGYEGSAKSIDIDLYRGAYRIHTLKIYKKSGHIPTPFLDIETVDLSLQWTALFHGRIVSDIELTKPVLNFAVNPSGTAKQTGAGIDWIKPIKALAPIDINHVIFKEGKLTYQDFSTAPKVNIYIHHMSGELSNLRNVVDRSDPLPSRLSLKGDSIGDGKLKIDGRLNILKPVPDMDIDTQLENVHLPALNDYSNAYALIDIRDGNLNVYSQLIIKDDQVSGYVKPIATNISLIDLRKSSNPAKIAWESVVSVFLTIFTNHHNDQFATKIELKGNLHNINTDTWSAIEGILHNAFVGALQKGLDMKDNTQPSAR